MAKASNNLTTYLPDDLAQRVADAKDAGTLDIKTVVKDALERALDPTQPDSQGDEVSQDAEQLATVRAHLEAANNLLSEHSDDLQQISSALGLDGNDETSLDTILAMIKQMREHPLRTASVEEHAADGHSSTQGATAYELRWAADETELQNNVDLINQYNGWLQSVAVDKDSRFLMLIAWPQNDDSVGEMG